MRLLCFVFVLNVHLLKGISNKDTLQVIDFRHKNISKLPNDISYSQTHSLYLDNTNILTLPSELHNANKLTTLSLNNNPQFNLEENLNLIKQLPLNSLSIDNSALMYLPIEFGRIKNLKFLSVTNNLIREIPEQIFLYSDFHELNISSNNISIIPKEIKSQINLSKICISYNPCINAENTYKNLIGLDNLKVLEIKGSEKLPMQLWEIVSIEKLDISDGRFENIKLPNTNYKHNLNSITAIECDNLDFSTLMPILSSPSLKEINIGGANFKGFNKATISSNIQQLVISGNDLDYFNFTSTLLKLEELIINFNNINCISEVISSISKNKNLKKLDILNSNLEQLPAQFSQLQQLEYLNLSGNKLNNIQEIYSLKKLKELDISNCNLNVIEIDKLKKQLPNTIIICNKSNKKIPLPNLNLNVEKYTITNEETKNIITQNGTKISIPKNSLQYEDGKPVKEPVIINYTPFYSLADISNSGINMNYVAKDTSAPFTSAGMFNLSASANGKNVELKKGKEITVEFKSNDPDKSYNYYLYDTTKQTWKQTGRDTITKINIKKKIDTAEVLQNHNLIPNLSFPKPPTYYKDHSLTINWKIDKNKKLNGTFTISAYYPKKKNEYDTSYSGNHFLEVKNISRIIWKIDLDKASPVIKEFLKENKLFKTNINYKKHSLKPRYYSSTTKTDKHIDFDIIPDKTQDNFLFIFYDENDTISFHAYPLIKNNNPDREQKNIKKLYFSYKKSADRRKIITKYRRDKYLASYTRFKNEMSAFRKGYYNELNKQTQDLLSQKVNNNNVFNITRTLELQGFGIYNCDRPVIIENPIVFTPVFYNDEGIKIKFYDFKLIDIKENIAVSYYSNIPVKTSKNSILTFIVTSNNDTKKQDVYIGKLKTFNENEIHKITEIKMSLVDKEVTLGELNAYINNVQ